MDRTNWLADGARRREVLLAATTGTALLAGCVGGGDTENGTENQSGEESDDRSDGSAETDSDDGGEDSGTETAGSGNERSVPVLGDPEADVRLEAYQDLNCPHCRTYSESGFPTIRAAFLEEARIRYEFRNFVVTGPAAEQAASAAREVFERHGNESFWSFKRRVYENQHRMPAETPAVFGDIARELGLDAGAITEAGRQRTHQDIVDADVDRGVDFGVQGTPSFVVDGSLVDTSGAATLDDVVDRVVQQVERALESQ